MQVFDFEYYNHAIRRLATKHAAFQLLIRRFTEYLHLHIIKYDNRNVQRFVHF